MSNLEFIEENHSYLLDGVLIPCVSDIICYKFPDLYKNIPSKILQNKAAYGTRCHELTEQYLSNELSLDKLSLINCDPNIKASIKRLDYLRKTFTFKVQNIERAVHYENVYAGTYDVLTSNNYIIDIKTTSVLHIDNKTLMAPLNLQISLYYYAAGIVKDIGYCIWMPKGKLTQIIEVKTWSEKQIKELLEEFKKHEKEFDTK